MPISPVPIPAAPPAPQISDSQEVFNERAEAYVEWQTEDFVPAINTIADNVYDNALEAEQDAISAAASLAAANAAVLAAEAAAEEAAVFAAAAGNYQGDYNAGTTYTLGQSVSYLGTIFVAKKTNLGITPVDGPDWYENGTIFTNRTSLAQVQAIALSF